NGRPAVADGENIIRLAQLNDAEPEWAQECMRTTTGALICNQANAVIALAALYPNCFGFDEMLQAAVLTAPLDDEDIFGDMVQLAGEAAQRAVRDAAKLAAACRLHAHGLGHGPPRRRGGECAQCVSPGTRLSR